MAENRTMKGESSNSPQDRNGTTRPLVESFKEYADSAPHSEMEDLSNHLNIALGTTATSNQQPSNTRSSAGLSSGGGGLRRTSGSQQQKQAASSAGRMLLSRPTADNKEEKKPSGLARGVASTGQINHNRRLSSNPRRESALGGIAASCAAVIPLWDGNYKPKSSSRRSSRAGSALSMSMKLAAQNALAELGEVSDDDEDEDWLKLSVLKEEGVSMILREDNDVEGG